jgi:hypothetical protein
VREALLSAQDRKEINKEVDGDLDTIVPHMKEKIHVPQLKYTQKITTIVRMTVSNSYTKEHSTTN